MGLFSFLSNKKEVRSLAEVLADNPCEAFISSKTMKYDKSGLSLAPLFAAVNIISNSCAVLPWKFLNRDSEDLKNSHYLYHLFDNTIVPRFLSVKNVIKDVLLDGNGFLYIVRDKETGRPKKLKYVPTSDVVIYYDNIVDYVYYQIPKWSASFIPYYDMIHFRMHTANGVTGTGIPAFARKTIETSNYTERAVTDYMASGGAVTGILTPNFHEGMPGTTPKQVKEMRQKFDEARATKGNTTIILPADLKFQQLSTNAKDAALVDMRLYNLTEICRWFNLSPVLLGDLSHTQYNSINETQKAYLQHTLQPFLVMMEEELNMKLIMPSKRGLEYIDIDEAAMLDTDSEKQANIVTNLETKGIISVNEARKKLGLPPVDGGDDLIVAYSNVNSNKLNSTEPEESKEEDTEVKEDDQDKNISE